MENKPDQLSIVSIAIYFVANHSGRLIVDQP